MKALMSMRAALEHPDIFGTILPGESWAAWRVLLIAVMGEELTDSEREIFRELTAREKEPGERVDEFWSIVGRRGGKTRAIAVLGSYIAALVDFTDVLAPGERASLPIISASLWQAQKAFQYLNGVFAGVPALKKLVTGQTSDTISLSTRVDIECRPASFRTIRGGTAVALIGDEIAFWRSDNSANPDTEILNAARPMLATTGGLLAAISSPYAQRGELHATFKRDFGPAGDAKILVAKAASTVMNPTLQQAVVDRAYQRDAAAASAEYGAEFRKDVSGWADLSLIEACVDYGVTVRPPEHGRRVNYRSFCDPSGGANDSFTMAVAHDEENIAVLDCLVEIKAPFNPTSATQQVAETLKSYGLTSTTGDRYAAQWVVDAFAKCGIRYSHSERDRSAIYLDALPLFTSGRVRLLDNPRVVNQFASLERRTSAIGKDRVDHGPRGQDDVCNSAAGALVDVDRRPALVREVDLLADGAALPLPSAAKYVFGVFAVDSRGQTATIYGAHTYVGAPLLLLDYDVGPLHGGSFSAIAVRLAELATKCRALQGSAIFLPANLFGPAVAQASATEVQKIPEHLVPGDLLLSCAGNINAGDVKICAPALEKARTSPLAAALDFRASEDSDDPLRQAALLAIAMSFP